MDDPRIYEFKLAPLRGRERITIDDTSLTVTNTKGAIRGRVDLADVTRVNIAEFSFRGLVSRWVDIHHSGKRVRLACNSGVIAEDEDVEQYRAAVDDLVQSLETEAPNAQIDYGTGGLWRLVVIVIGAILLGTGLLCFGISFMPNPHEGFAEGVRRIAIGMIAIGAIVILCARPWRK